MIDATWTGAELNNFRWRPSHTANANTVTFADGRNFFMGLSGGGAPDSGR